MIKHLLCVMAAAIALSMAIPSQAADAKSKVEVVYTLPADKPDLDQKEMIKAIGLRLVRTYALDDGKGFKFRPDSAPAVSLEFRDTRVNVAWSEYRDNPAKFGKLNEENAQAARRALTFALGAPLAGKIIEYTRNNQPASIRTQYGKITVAPGMDGSLILVSIPR